jgi:uncharacterized delta-60 repeat protein
MRNVHGILAVFAVAFFLSGPGASYAAPGDVMKDLVYSSRPGEDGDHGRGVALDGEGGITVTGYVTHKKGDYDFLTLRYGPDGTLKWARLSGNTWYDVGRAVAIDSAGSVIVAGASYNLERSSHSYLNSYYTDFHIIKYDPSGEPLLETAAQGNLKSNEPAAVAVGPDESFYVTGSARNAPDTYPEYYTVKFDQAGEVLWEKVEDWGTEACATGIQSDPSGNIWVTGYYKDAYEGNYNIRTLKYSPDGLGPLTTLTYNTLYDDEKAWGMSVDPGGGVIVTGETSASGGSTLTVKYSPSGEMLWAAKYQHPQYKTHGNAVATDRFGRVYVAGKTDREEQKGDFLLLVYDRRGRLIDEKVYAFGGDSAAEGVAVDKDGNIVMTGTTTLLDEPAVARTVVVEGYPLTRSEESRPSGHILDQHRRLALKRPAKPMVRKVLLTMNKAGLKDTDAPLSLVAEPVSLPGDFEYRFFLMGKDNAHHWEAATSYTDKNFFVLKPSNGSKYASKVMVQVREKGSGLPYEASSVLELDHNP